MVSSELVELSNHDSIVALRHRAQGDTPKAQGDNLDTFLQELHMTVLLMQRIPLTLFKRISINI